MERGKQFHDPKALHPNMNFYKDGGLGGEGEDHSVVGYVRTETLSGMHGNQVERAGIERHKAALQSGQGFTDPVMVEIDPDSKRAVLGEGNHRVEAARELGISHVPTRVVRSRITDARVDNLRDKGGNPQTIAVPMSPWKSGDGSDYWPSDIHPRHIFGKDVL